MIINLSPVRMDEELMLDREGDVLYLNGEVFDFGPLSEGATLPREAIHSKWFSGPVERIDGELVLTLVLPHGPNAPDEARFPTPINLPDDGTVDLPAFALPEPEPEPEPEPVMAPEPEEPAEQEPEQ